MVQASPPIVRADIREISAVGAGKLWLDVLSRQGLSGGPKLPTAVAVAERALGLHAARLPSPYATLLARLDDHNQAGVIFGDVTGHNRFLTTVRCMRKTLHTLPISLGAIAHSATRHFRERDALRAAYNAGYSPAETTAMAGRLVALMAASGPLSPREIEARLSPAHAISEIRVGMKLAWERGDLTYMNQSPHWNRERRVFGVTTEVVPGFSASVDHSKAADLLIEAYFDRYGPASIHDAVWWSGLTKSHVLSALNQSVRPIIGLLTPWATNVLYMFDDGPSGIARELNSEMAIDFLAHEDVALKAYFETRARYLAYLPPGKVFNQIGEVLPTILRGGQIIGRWDWDRASRRVVWETFDVATHRDDTMCARLAGSLTRTLLERYDRPGRAERSANL